MGRSMVGGRGVSTCRSLSVFSPLLWKAFITSKNLSAPLLGGGPPGQQPSCETPQRSGNFSSATVLDIPVVVNSTLLPERISPYETTLRVRLVTASDASVLTIGVEALVSAEPVAATSTVDGTAREVHMEEPLAAVKELTSQADVEAAVMDVAAAAAAAKAVAEQVVAAHLVAEASVAVQSTPHQHPRRVRRHAPHQSR